MIKQNNNSVDLNSYTYKIAYFILLFCICKDLFVNLFFFQNVIKDHADNLFYNKIKIFSINMLN